MASQGKKCQAKLPQGIHSGRLNGNALHNLGVSFVKNILTAMSPPAHKSLSKVHRTLWLKCVKVQWI